MDLTARRKIINVSPNPNSNLDYVTGFEGEIGAPAFERPAEIILRYVPDRMILDATSFENYLEFIGQSNWSSLEELAVTILDDVRNELVARWVQVIVKHRPQGLSHLHRQAITLEDYQPNWDNEDLLSHLPLI